MSDYVDSIDAQLLGEALNALPNTARTRILETLKSDKPIAFQTWIHQPRDDNEEYCGCLLMDGFGQGYTNSQWRELLSAADDDESNVVQELLMFYGMEAAESSEITISHAVNKYDTFLYYHSAPNWVQWTTEAWGGVDARLKGVLTRVGKDAVLAVFQRYVSVEPTA